MKNPFKTAKFKRNKEKILIIFGAGVLLTFWLAGYIAQFNGSILTGEATMSWNPFKCIYAAIKQPQVLLMFLMVYAGIGGWIYLKYKDNHRIDTEADERGF